MPWTKNTYPPSMKNLPAAVRNKAIEIANALYAEKSMKEGIMIATAISRAKDWAKNRGLKAEPKKGARKTDVKKHGEDVYVIPTADGWAVKKEKGKRKKSYDDKETAVKQAKQEAKKANAAVTVQRKDGKIGKRVSYNPNRKQTAKRTS